MIGRLSGILESKELPDLLVDVNGVGYEIQVPMSAAAHLIGVGEKITLYTHLYLREEGQLLYGFFDPREKAVFRLLIKVSGVGPKLALSLLSNLKIETLVHCIEQKDIGPLVGISGVGRKTAERLLIELKGKLCLWAGIGVSPIGHGGTPVQEATEALVALGYRPSEAAQTIKGVSSDSEKGVTTQDLIRQALQVLGPRS